MRADTLLQVARLVLKPGIALRATTIAQLGRFRTPNVAVLADHRIVERGLYRIRHPSYPGAPLAFLGFSLALANWLSLVVIMGILLPIYLNRIHEEEAALAAAFGADCRAYCQHTKHLLSGVCRAGSAR